MLKMVVVTAVLAGGAMPVSARGQAATTAPGQAAPAKPNDYGDPSTWLCLPGRKDACAVDERATIVTADGKLTREAWTADPNAQVDCFYVYPTVSTDQTPNSDMIPDPAEKNVVQQQFARFASKCRPYAPIYRQVTLAGLLPMLRPGATTRLDQGVQYDDVRDAWNYYLRHDNLGRAFVLVGHSQGSIVLTRLIREEIEGKPIQSRMLSAILAGTTIAVPKGQDVGGSFQQVPLCRSASQLGCVITFASFRSTVAPPPNSLFGRVTNPNLIAGCTNPASLAGGSGDLHAYLDAEGSAVVTAQGIAVGVMKPWVTPPQKITTPFVSVPGLLSAKCASNENASGYLEVTVHGDPGGHRVNDITGDLGTLPNVLANWGLHLVDINLTIGNLLDIVGQETNAYLSKKGAN